MVSIELLSHEHLDLYVQHLARHLPEPGVDGIISQPFSQNEVINTEKLKRKIFDRWSRIPGEGNWEVTWGVFDNDKIIAHLELVGGNLIAMSHRAKLGMGVEQNYRRQGLAKRLIEIAIDWSNSKKFLSWIDLYTFSHNKVAIHLYESFGFQKIGTTTDLLRVDGKSIDDTHYVLKLKGLP